MNITLDDEQVEKVVVAFLKESIRFHLDEQLAYDRKDEDFNLMAGLYSVLEYCSSNKEYQEFVKEVEF